MRDSLVRLSQRRTSMDVALALVAGVILGLFSHGSSSLPGGWRWLGNFGALWVAVAFLVGWLSRVKPAPILGATSLVAASLVHYVPFRLAREGLSWQAFRWPVVLWVGVGIIVGSVSASLGAAYARRKPFAWLIGVAFLAAAFAGEAIVLLRTGHPRAVRVAVPVEVALSLLVPLILVSSWRTRLQVLGLTALTIPVVVLGLSAFMGVIHRVYPGI